MKFQSHLGLHLSTRLTQSDPKSFTTVLDHFLNKFNSQEHFLLDQLSFKVLIMIVLFAKFILAMHLDGMLVFPFIIN